MGRYMIKLDARRCIGCGACEVQCQVKSRTPAAVRPGQVVTATLPAEAGSPRMAAAFRPCFHCETPWCVAACPLHLLSLEPQGWKKKSVLGNASACTGCRLCAVRCPFQVITMVKKKPPGNAGGS